MPAEPLPSRVRRWARFGLVGGVNTAIDIATFAVLVAATSIAPAPANVLAFLVATSASFFGNRGWTFADRASNRPLALSYALFLGLTALNAGLATLALSASLAAGSGLVWAKAASVAVSLALNYTVMNRIVFRPPPAP